MRVCIFQVRRRLLAGISIVYLNFGKFKNEYTLRVCIEDEKKIRLQCVVLRADFLCFLVIELV